MTDAVCVLLHWNTDYAEIPRRELSNVIAKSFEPMVAAINEWRQGTICFNLTGHTILDILNEQPTLIDDIKELVDAQVVEIVASAYSHPILPLLPAERIRSQIKSHLDLIQSTFGIIPKGFWPPEIAVSPTVLNIAKEEGIEWTYIDHEHFQLAQWFGNDNNPYERRDKTVNEILVDAYWASNMLSKLKTYWRASRALNKAMQKHLMALATLKVANSKKIRAYLVPRAWSVATQFSLSDNIPSIFLSEEKQLKQVLNANVDYLPLYASDIEFFGYRGLGNKPPTPEKFISFLSTLKREGLDTISPSQIPQKLWPSDAKFIGTGSWSPDTSLRIWRESEDNKEYTRRLNKIYAQLEQHDYVKDDAAKYEEIRKWLRVAENSDARGWQPIPERKHEAYTAILNLEQIITEL